jgi:hypothetical protein
VQLKRRIVEDLRPSLLDNMGLAAALQSYCEDFARATAWIAKRWSTIDADSAGPMQAIALFRIAQESLEQCRQIRAGAPRGRAPGARGEGWRWKSATMASAFRRMRCGVRSRTACWACANARCCWAGPERWSVG